ncbi:hypothetical protein D0Z00_004158 [Geotrichum galactomycetum]|uniref:Uncharacterized protein n=1 Tax=Geotrichum galactomycetum TaxID=27317 RepID=A0ACB6UZA3_9ASCO|nr:hypothetical protein D0Z00_004158 [Geotrichum candidum]
MAAQKSGIAIGINKGHKVTPRQKAARVSYRKGAASARTTFVRDIIQEVAGLAPYERRIIELLRNSQEKRARKLAKKKLGTFGRAKAKVESMTRPSSSLETCFNLLRNGAVLDLTTTVEEIEGLAENNVIDLAYSAYNETEAKLHLAKVKDVLGFPNESGVDGTRSYPVLSTGGSNFYNIKGYNIPEEEQAAYVEKEAFDPETLSVPFSTKSLTAPSALLSTKRAVRSLNLSHWNPPPAHFQLKGHLFYLQANTLEGKTFHITASTAGYFVNNTSGEKFDPTISKKTQHSHSLLTLLKQISPSVEETIAKNVNEVKEIDPLAYIKPTNAFFTAPWIVNTPSEIPDLSRTQNISDESTNKDWNEEIQSARELSKETFSERLIRERLINRTLFDFTETSIKEALEITKGNVLPLNIAEPPITHIYLKDNIFYSHAYDATGVYAELGGDAASRYATGKEPRGVTFVNKIDVDGLNTLGSTVIDYCGRRYLAQTPVPGIFRTSEGESLIAYGSVDDNDSIASDKKFAELFSDIAKFTHSKPRTVLDNSGNASELVISRKINGLVGNDKRDYVLDLNHLTPVDIGFYEELKESSVEYPHKIGSLRIEAVEEWWRSKARADVAQALEAKKAEAAKNAPPKEETPKKEESEEKKEGEESEEKEEEKEPEVTLTREEEEAIITAAYEKYLINTDVPLDLSVISDEAVRAQYAKDAEVIREISAYVKKSITQLLEEFKTGASVPFDGAQLSATLHRRGINIRYLGQIATESENQGPLLQVVHQVVLNEIISRSVKHVLNSILSNLSVDFAPYAITHVFNCLLGYKLNDKPEAVVDPLLTSLYPNVDTSVYSEVTVESLRASIAEQAASRFRYTLGEDWISKINPLVLFREISLKYGLQWASRDFDFNATAASVSASTSSTASNKKTKKGKKQVEVAAAAPVLFSHEHLLNIVPIVKSSEFKSSASDQALENGRLSIAHGDIEVGLEILTESLSIHENAYGLIHPETVRIYNQLAIVYNELNKPEVAVQFARKALLIQERLTGLDSAEGILSYINLAIYEHSNNNTAAALELITHAFKYWSSIASPEHPESITTINNIGAMVQNLKLHALALKWYEHSLKLTTKLYGPTHHSVGALHFQLSQVHLVLEDFNAAVESMRESHKIYKENYGPENTNTKETKLWLAQLINIAVATAKNNKNSATANGQSAEHAAAAAALAASASKRARVHHRPASAADAKTATIGKKKSASAAKLGDKSINELLDYINGTAPSQKKKKAAKKN